LPLCTYNLRCCSNSVRNEYAPAEAVRLVGQAFAFDDEAHCVCKALGRVRDARWQCEDLALFDWDLLELAPLHHVQTHVALQLVEDFLQVHCEILEQVDSVLYLALLDVKVLALVRARHDHHLELSTVQQFVACSSHHTAQQREGITTGGGGGNRPYKRAERASVGPAQSTP